MVASGYLVAPAIVGVEASVPPAGAPVKDRVLHREVDPHRLFGLDLGHLVDLQVARVKHHRLRLLHRLTAAREPASEIFVGIGVRCSW